MSENEMTDNRTTELREKLNKLIIELDRLDTTLDSPASDMTLGEYEQEREKLLDGFMQAIAATLGGEREKALEELVRDMWFWGYEGHMDSESQDWQMKHIDGVLGRMKELGIEVIDE